MYGTLCVGDCHLPINHPGIPEEEGVQMRLLIEVKLDKKDYDALIEALNGLGVEVKKILRLADPLDGGK